MSFVSVLEYWEFDFVSVEGQEGNWVRCPVWEVGTQHGYLGLSSECSVFISPTSLSRYLIPLLIMHTCANEIQDHKASCEEGNPPCQLVQLQSHFWSNLLHSDNSVIPDFSHDFNSANYY
jgi:hypothetical protein